MPFCSQCGQEVPDNLSYCSNCGASTNLNAPMYSQASGPYQGRPYIDNHLTKAILVTIFCCIPLGIASIVQASSVNGKLQSGDVNGALQASEQADKLANWGIGVGVAVTVIYWIVVIVAGVLSEY